MIWESPSHRHLLNIYFRISHEKRMLFCYFVVCGRRSRNYFSCCWIFCLIYTLSTPTTALPLHSSLSLCHITLPPSPSYLPISSISSLYLSQPILIFLPKYLNIIAADTGAVSVLSFSWKNFNRDRSSPERRRRVEDVGNDVSATPLFRVVVKNDASRANWKLDKKHFKRANHLFIFVY